MDTARGKHSGISRTILLLLFDQVKLHASERIIKYNHYVETVSYNRSRTFFFFLNDFFDLQ